MSVNLYLTDAERETLEAVRVGIAGAGGLGSNCAAHLVRAGVRRLVLADFDTVSPSNLNRQFFFRDQVGLPKVRALADNLLRIEPELELDLRPVRLGPENLHAVFDTCGILIEAFDNVDSKQAILAAFRDRPVIAASGLAGWGHSSEMKVRRIGTKLILVGDGATAVSDDRAPQSPRVGLAAALQANAALSLILGEPL